MQNNNSTLGLFDDSEDMPFSIFECTICQEYLVPPIMLCELGHSICGNCFRQMEFCTTCHSPFTNIRNGPIERIIKVMIFPCAYASFGCTELITLDNMDAHKSVCRFKRD